MRTALDNRVAGLQGNPGDGAVEKGDVPGVSAETGPCRPPARDKQAKREAMNDIGCPGGPGHA
uniref:Uncharacterized protein n=1 Tax=viral metagenome TaxID=1070528 RepID=A0A6M3L9T9_9ZZZZ